MPDEDDDKQTEEEQLQDLPPEEGEASEVSGGARIAYPG